VEIADLIHDIRNGQSNLIPDDLARVWGDIAVMISAWERNVDFKLYSYEEAFALDSNVASWIQFAENAALGSHAYILEDGPELPKSSGPHAEDGGEILDGMHAQGCTTIEDSRTREKSGREGGLGTVSIIITRSCRHCFEGFPGGSNVIT
jgi:hypothetical protein